MAELCGLTLRELEVLGYVVEGRSNQEISYRRVDVGGLERTVALPPGIGRELRDRITRVERAMNHHAVVVKQVDGTTFRVWTHARGTVTDLDVEPARRISEVIDNG